MMQDKLRSLFLLCLLPIWAQCQSQTPATELPKIILIGDSIRLGYAPIVAKRLAGKATIVSSAANGGDSRNVLSHLDEWVIREKPAIIHINCGLHDLKLAKQTKRHQVELAEYEKNLQQIVDRLRRETSAAILFASTTPILDDRHAQRGAEFDRVEADVRRYNEVAVKVMRAANVTINDLHWVVTQGGAETLLGKDGTHYTPAGYERLAEAVADSLLRQLTILQYKPLPLPRSGPEAAAGYRKAEADGDALVPEAYRTLPAGQFQLPDTAAAWRRQRPEVLKTVQQSLGDLPARPSPQRVRLIARELRNGYTLEKVAIHNGVDNEVSAILLIPDGLRPPAPAVLWLHSSTPDKTQIIIPNTNGGAEPLGETLVKAGYVVMSVDAYWHGDRVGAGPSGVVETGLAEHQSLFKYHLWFGRTLWGMFVRDDQIALDYLYNRPEVNKARIGATGMSMGSTRAWWLAAVDERVAAVAGVACLTRYQNLIAHGQLRQHGVYYFVNGLLKHFDTEGVIALIAPRPYLALTGDLDAGSPADGIKIIEEKVGQVYQKLEAKDRFRSILYPNTGHTYTPEMRHEMLRWFDRWLKRN
ncbi:MAG: GDSL-type esterase/lipase family protein [Blastocatellia bacterium]